MPLLTLSDASLAYGHVPLLDHADFQLDPGERVALIGRNGCGKSSLLRALAGTGGLDDGSVWLEPGVRASAGRLEKLDAELSRLAKFTGVESVNYLEGWREDG